MDGSEPRPPWVPGRWWAGRLGHLLEWLFPSWAPLDSRSYSNQGEDRVLLDLLHGHASPVYVDVGAYEPVRMSDTYLLYRHGWRGVVVEADASRRGAWRRRRPRDVFVAKAVDVKAGRRTLFLQDESSTLVDAWSKDTARQVEVDCVTLNDVLAGQGLAADAIGLLKIDIEGVDLDVLETLDTRRWRPSAILVETHHWTTADAVGDARLQRWCRSAGYVLVGHNRRNLLLAHRAWLARRFAAPGNPEAYAALNPRLYGRRERR